jgi:FkbM family methyltransferase
MEFIQPDKKLYKHLRFIPKIKLIDSNLKNRMNFFQNKLNGLKRRIHSKKYGMFYWRNSDYKIPHILTVNGNNTELRVENMDINEFTGICINDCYHLGYLKKKLGIVKTIVDVGANQGMFIIAARQFFPTATIHCYEPNPQLLNTLYFNAQQLNATPYFEAVMQEDCKVDLHFTDSDLATTASESISGIITGSSLKTIFSRIGAIDILKLDCEGSEWGLLADTESWKQVKSLSMEYHLWGKANSKIEDIFIALKNINFELIHHTAYNSQQGLVVAINKIILNEGE